MVNTYSKTETVSTIPIEMKTDSDTELFHVDF